MVDAVPHSSAVAEVSRMVSLAGSATETQENASTFTAGPKDGDGAYKVAVAVQQGNILATAFHPELGNDLRWHR